MLEGWTLPRMTPADRWHLLVVVVVQVLPWDIVLHKVDSPQFPGGLLFMYARDDELQIKTMTVNETANEMPPSQDSEEDVDHPANLAVEASAINQNFSQQILKRPVPAQDPSTRSVRP